MSNGYVLFLMAFLVAIAIILTLKAKPAQDTRKVKIDYRGAVLISAAMGLIVLGLQQAAVWGWGDVRTWACIVVGAALLAVFTLFELRVSELRLRIERAQFREALLRALLELLEVGTGRQRFGHGAPSFRMKPEVRDRRAGSQVMGCSGRVGSALHADRRPLIRPTAMLEQQRQANKRLAELTTGANLAYVNPWGANEPRSRNRR